MKDQNKQYEMTQYDAKREGEMHDEAMRRKNLENARNGEASVRFLSL